MGPTLKINAQKMLDVEYPGENFEYMEIGPSPEAEGVPNPYDRADDEIMDLSVQVCSDTIRMNLMEQMRLSNGRLKLLEEIERGDVIPDNIVEMFEGASLVEKNICFLWSAFLKRWDLLNGLLEIGCQLNFSDPNGISALHLAAFSGCLTSASFLISKGLDVNLQTQAYSPLHCSAFGNAPETAKLLISHGANIQTATKKESLEESLLHCAIRANAIECVKLFIDEGADVNSLHPKGTNPIHLAADLGYTKCLRVLLDAPNADSNIRICTKESTALHLAADEGNAECVLLLLSKGADAKLKNHRGFTALHLAARTSSVECVDALLSHGAADPNAEDFDKRTPLHAAVNKSDNAFEIIEMLIGWGANLNHKDIYGFTALHLAALDGLSHCVEMMVFHGADVSTRSKKGTSALNVISRKTPNSLKMINQMLDSAITCHYRQEGSNRELELELDFRRILQYCHPREIGYLNMFIEEGQKELLKHPLCSAFLYMKWEKIRKFYIVRLVFCFVFILFLTLYVLTALAHNCYNGSRDKDDTIEEQELCQKQSILGDLLRSNPFVIEMQWWVLVAITIIEIFRKLFGVTAYKSMAQYFSQFENIIDWFIIASVFVISYIYTNRTYTWQNHIGAFAVLVGWTNLMLMVGQLPIFGSYVAMYTKVQKEFAKLFLAYLCMLIGFTFSFCVVFPDNPSFANPFIAFITVLIMMVGEQDFSLLINEPDGKDPPFLLEISAQITFVLFLMFVTVILMNLLVGIAVEDIQGLKKTAALSKLVRQTKLISYIESALFNIYLPSWLKCLLHNTALVSPQAYRVVMCVRPLNPGEMRLPKEILRAAYEVGVQRKVFHHTVTPVENENAFVNVAPHTPTKNPYDTPIKEEKISLGTGGVDIDYGFETESVLNLTSKVDDNVVKIDRLTTEVKDLKALLLNNHSQIERLVAAVSALNASGYGSGSSSSGSHKLLRSNSKKI